jgi:glycerophosphoryl diester phosphodiesterase
MVFSSPGSRAFGPKQGALPLVFGHRGASALATENTVEAFARAMADGADGVELDVQRCASGEIVVFHDEDLARLAGRSGRIRETPWRLLRKVQLRGGGTIPTLDEVLAALPSPALINIEIKPDRLSLGSCRALVEGVADVVDRAEARDRVLISSFHPGVVWYWQHLRPTVPIGLLVEQSRRFSRPWPSSMAWLAALLRPLALHPEDVLCSPEKVAFWRGQGFALNVWTVDQPQRIAGLAAMGVAGIITNNPAVACSALTLTLRSSGG